MLYRYNNKGEIMDITIKELEEKQREIFEKRKEYDEAKKIASHHHAELEKLEMEHVERLETLGKTSYKSDIGTFSFRYEESFKIDPENKSLFFEFLKKRAIFEEMISVNSRTLNSFAKQEALHAEEEGILDFNLPGLIKSEPVARTSLRKA
jgi:hypothetical protein